MSECRHCGCQIYRDEEGVWIDNGGGDVCGHAGGNEPHEPPMSATRQVFWRAPSGRIHHLRSCSGAAPEDRMVQVRLTRDEYDVANRCRCARWRETRLQVRQS